MSTIAISTAPGRPSLLQRARAHWSARNDIRRMESELTSMTSRKLNDIGIHPGDIGRMLHEAYLEAYDRRIAEI